MLRDGQPGSCPDSAESSAIGLCLCPLGSACAGAGCSRGPLGGASRSFPSSCTNCRCSEVAEREEEDIEVDGPSEDAEAPTWAPCHAHEQCGELEYCADCAKGGALRKLACKLGDTGHCWPLGDLSTCGDAIDGNCPVKKAGACPVMVVEDLPESSMVAAGRFWSGTSMRNGMPVYRSTARSVFLWLSAQGMWEVGMREDMPAVRCKELVLGPSRSSVAGGCETWSAGWSPSRARIRCGEADKRPSLPAGCARHSDCSGLREYCGSCTQCGSNSGGDPGACLPCPTRDGGTCFPRENCWKNHDSIDGACPHVPLECDSHTQCGEGQYCAKCSSCQGPTCELCRSNKLAGRCLNLDLDICRSTVDGQCLQGEPGSPCWEVAVAAPDSEPASSVLRGRYWQHALTSKGQSVYFHIAPAIGQPLYVFFDGFYWKVGTSDSPDDIGMRCTEDPQVCDLQWQGVWKHAVNGAEIRCSYKRRV